MTAVTVSSGPLVTAWHAERRAVAVLGLREGRRMLTRPAYLLVLGLIPVRGLGAFFQTDTISRSDVRDLLTGALLTGALATLITASLVATAARRSGAEAQLAPAPLDPQLRTLSLGLGVLVGPVAVAGLLTTALAYADHGEGSVLPDTFDGWAYLQLPLMWLGAGLLGVAAARWLPWPGVPLVLLVGLIAWSVAGVGALAHDNDIGYLMPFLLGPDHRLGIGWHACYLAGLGLLALTAGLLRDLPLRRRPMLALLLSTLLLTAASAWMQLP